MLSPSPNPYQQALAHLYGRINYERATVPSGGLQLDRMRRLMAALGNPQQQLLIVHVAGTKGKGSVSAMLAGALQAAGYRTGLYTSPHLERLEERYVIDGKPCEEANLVELVEQMVPVIEAFDANDDPPTFFELTTALAFLHFANQAVEAVVLEVGMGGRLDSTNICEPCLSVITSISHDHTKALGDTLEAIATEKAGIIKPGVPVVSGVLAAGARETIATIASKRGCRLMQLEADFTFSYRAESGTRGDRRSLVQFQSNHETFANLGEVELAMMGEHQAVNAAVAIASLAELYRQGWHVDAESIRRGLATSSCPARIEVIGESPTVILDAAHNAAAAAALANTLREHFPDRRRRLLFAIARDKEIESVLAPLSTCFDELIVTRFQSNPRGADPREVAEIARGIPAARWQVRTLDEPRQALDTMLAEANDAELLCIAGSFFLAAELRSMLVERRNLIERQSV